MKPSRHLERFSMLSIVVLLAASIVGCDIFDRYSDDDNGPCGGYPSQSQSPYVLPYSVGSTFLVTQGNCGNFTHTPGSDYQYAYDWRMPIGTTVTAVRGGRVFSLVESFFDGNGGGANFVTIEHDDGTYGRYIHMTRNGVLVELNETVIQGQPIALSGNTGFSTEPHLHFQIDSCLTTSCSLPTVFRNTESHPGGLVAGRSYRADPL